MQLYVCGLTEVDQYIPKVNGIISIMAPGERILEPKEVSKFSPLLRLDFDDTWEEVYQAEEEIINPTMLETAVRFVEDIYLFQRKNTEILVHCHAGISRSSALAIAIYTAFTDDHVDAVNRVSQQRPQAAPNMAVIRLADNLLNKQGQLIDQVLQIFYPNLLDLIDLNFGGFTNYSQGYKTQ